MNTQVSLCYIVNVQQMLATIHSKWVLDAGHAARPCGEYKNEKELTVINNSQITQQVR